MTPAVLVVAGLDPTGAAGLLADARALARHGVLARGVVTAHTVQGEGGVRSIHPVATPLFADELRAALAASPPPAAIKVGMIATAELAAALVGVLEEERAARLPLVWDPVLAASRGGALYDGALADLAPLLRRATLVTPNLAEAAALADLPPVENEPAMGRAAGTLLARGARAVLVKGGHLPGEAADLLATPDGVMWLRAPRLFGPPVRGTGCALSASIAARLAHGDALGSAVRAAKEDVAGRIAAAHAAGSSVLA